MTEPFDLIIFDTYDVAFVRSPQYLAEELLETVDMASRALMDEAKLWARLRRRHRWMTAADVVSLQDRLAAKFCKNLDVWRALPGWRDSYRLALLHGGPVGLLGRWRSAYDLDSLFDSAVAGAAIGMVKSDPALYARLAADAGLPPERCLLVDDERIPMQAARDAGLGAYRYGTVYGLRAVLADPSLAFERDTTPPIVAEGAPIDAGR